MPRRRPSVAHTVRGLLSDLVTFARLGLTSRARLAAENLFLRKQLALYQSGDCTLLSLDEESGQHGSGALQHGKLVPQG
jgi:hypothetical protein